MLILNILFFLRRENVLLPSHVKPVNGIFLNCWPCCIRGGEKPLSIALLGFELSISEQRSTHKNTFFFVILFSLVMFKFTFLHLHTIMIYNPPIQCHPKVDKFTFL